MGRPIKSVYFGNRNTDGSGVGGEGVSNVTIADAGEGYFSANAGVTFSAPQITGGTTATGTPVLDGNGSVTGVTITAAGSGYTSAPTAIFTGANTTPATANVVSLSTSARDNAIIANAWVTGASMGKSGDIVAQKGSRRYRVLNADGTSVCRLVANSAVISAGGPLGVGEMTITAVDSDGGVYYVKKLTGNEAVMIPDDGAQFSEDQKVLWTLGSPTEDVSVQISNQ